MESAANSGGRVVVFGSINVDLVCRVEAIARPGETVLSPGYEQFFGGKGANQAVAAARVLGGARVAMIGAIGPDELGGAARANLEGEGIDLSALAVLDAPTGCAFIVIDASGENAITVASGANARLGGLDPAHLAPGDVLVLQMEVPKAASIEAARAARARGGRVVLNLAPVPADLSAADLELLLPLADVLVVNETELEAVARLLALPGPFEAEAKALVSRFAMTLVATLGAQGALVARSGLPPARVPALRVEPVDTTGAGDTFVGVLAAGLAEGRDFREATARAVAAASLACLGLGAQTAMPGRDRIDAALGL
ncbi:ribokinase [Aurantimonas sp. Leaf443]|uniref:ribokinase n=1 Tax=Aurantimonas sp. Leaf443 TaxID=1736378 RepID=UPI0006FB589E|nr:ribokinase [Aurantimonas sp. Leaf443]KQT84025.1 ribokinase [Aurantimonas sp. Leaf443]